MDGIRGKRWLTYHRERHVLGRCMYALKEIDHKSVQVILRSEAPADWVRSQLAACICSANILRQRQLAPGPSAWHQTNEQAPVPVQLTISTGGQFAMLNPHRWLMSWGGMPAGIIPARRAAGCTFCARDVWDMEELPSQGRSKP